MKSQNVILLITVQIISHFFYCSDRAFASSCPFDSYMIINGACHDLTQEPKNLTLEKAKPSSSYNTDFEYNEPQVSTKKLCEDFTTQESAQFYFERYPEHKYLDVDRDGYACDNLRRINNNWLTTAIWNNLIYENRQKKLQTKNEHSLSYEEVIEIIGFYPNASKGNKIIWEDPIENRKIKIRFHNNEIMDMKGTGFKN